MQERSLGGEKEKNMVSVYSTLLHKDDPVKSESFILTELDEWHLG